MKALFAHGLLLPMHALARHMSPMLVLALGLAVSPSHAADTTSERMWLPASAQHLRPFLAMAVEEALRDESCTEVLYARLNEYRTIYEEPTFTILCKKDYKTTFNKVFHITQIDPDYNSRIAESVAAAANAQSLSGAIESLRQQLSSPTEVIVPPATTTAPPAPSEAPVSTAPPAFEEDPNDLSLDLLIDSSPE